MIQHVMKKQSHSSLLAIILVIIGLASASAVRAVVRPPNIVFSCTDDQGHGDHAR